MDATVIATSLPAIAADIGTTPVALKLAFTAYFVALAVFISISAWLSDRFGAKNVFRIAIFVFVFGSLGCAFASSLQAFVLARFLQGMGGAMMSPIARLMLYRITPRQDLVRSTAWLTIPAVIAPMLGPPLGGFLTTFISWHWIFLINVPIGVAGLVMITRFIPEIEAGPARALDVPGFLLLALTFSGTVFGLSLFSMPVLPLWVACVATSAGLISGALYVLHAKRALAPMLDPRLFREPVMRSSIAGAAIFHIGAGALPFLLPLMLQLGFGMTPFESGLITFIGAFGALLTKLGAERLYGTIGFRAVMIAAAVITAALLAVKATFTPETPLVLIMLTLLAGGLARSAFFTGQHVLVVAQIRPEDAGQATAIDTITRPIGTALGVALAGGILEASARAHGGGIGLADFHTAFLSIGAITLLAVLPLLSLPKDAGSAVSSGSPARSRAAPLREAGAATVLTPATAEAAARPDA